MCDHHGCGHEHIPPPEAGTAGATLWSQIDRDSVQALNERVPGTARQIIRAHEDRLSTSPLCESDADEELLITIPFTALVKLHSLLVRAPADSRAPKTIRLFKNSLGLDFDAAASRKPTQQLHFPADVGIGTAENDGIVEFALARAHWAATTSISIFISDNHGNDVSAMSYIGLRGEWQPLNRTPVIALYEAAADPRDHKVAERTDTGARSAF